MGRNSQYRQCICVGIQPDEKYENKLPYKLLTSTRVVTKKHSIKPISVSAAASFFVIYLKLLARN